MRALSFPRGLSHFFDEALQEMSRDHGDSNLHAHQLAPLANVIETEHGYEITMDLPGLGSDDFEVRYDHGQLTVSGERNEERHEEDEQRVIRVTERRYGKFSRSFRLPVDVDAEKIEAGYDRGVLTVTLPKAEHSKPRKIEVK